MDSAALLLAGPPLVVFSVAVVTVVCPKPANLKPENVNEMEIQIFHPIFCNL